MPEKHEDMERQKLKFVKQLILYLFVLVVFGLSILAFSSPVSEGLSQAESTATSAPIDQTSNPTEMAQTPTPDPEDMPPPTPEEIGYTDGIIIWSTILIIILLIGTLRETIRREGR